jgi:very-short-patch-repair endonuclease
MALSREEFIRRANIKHEYKYDYSQLIYKTVNENVDIICPIHGHFSQWGHSHLSGSGCKKCAFEKMSEKRKFTKEQFIEKSKAHHGDKYDYSLVDYKNKKTKVKIICPIHGEFEQVAGEHMRGSGCDKCRVLNITFTKEQFIERSKVHHGDKYDYSLVDYKNASKKVKIICPIHGEFEQMAYSHTGGKGCSKCAVTESKPEEKVAQFLIDNNINFKDRDRTLIKPYELDFILEEYKIAIEVDGVVWHSEKFGKSKDYHIMKTKLCNDRGYSLIHIYEDEINNDFENVKQILLKNINSSEKFVDNIITLDRRFYNFPPNGYRVIKELEPNYFYSKSNRRITQKEYNSLPNKKGWYKIWDCGQLLCEKSP